MPQLRLLIISPAFHGYWRAYEDAFTRLGYRVRTLRYDELPSRSAKVRHKLGVELMDRLGADGSSRWARRTSALCAKEVLSSRPDRVLVIRGDILGEDFWEAVTQVGARPLTLIYDEVARMGTSYEQLMRHGPVASYSAHDTAQLAARGARTAHVRDAYDSHLPFHPVASDEVVFIGALYGLRGTYMESLHRAQIPVRAYGRSWSHHIWDRIRTWDAPRPDLPAHRDVPRDLAYGIQAGALASLNVHDQQDGFTMRTYEIPGVGGLQLIDRDDVEDLYEPGTEVLVFHSSEELVDLVRRAATDTAWARSIRRAGRRRTLAEHTFDHRVLELAALWD
nr:glycosyltransferase [Actinomyces sp.]